MRSLCAVRYCRSRATVLRSGCYYQDDCLPVLSCNESFFPGQSSAMLLPVFLKSGTELGNAATRTAKYIHWMKPIDVLIYRIRTSGSVPNQTTSPSFPAHFAPETRLFAFDLAMPARAMPCPVPMLTLTRIYAQSQTETSAFLAQTETSAFL
eukprot:139211-Rhodomonas_salina.1